MNFFLAVSHAGWLTSEQLRALLFLSFFVAMGICLTVKMILEIRESRRDFQKLKAQNEQLENARYAYPYPDYHCRIGADGDIWVTPLRSKKANIKRRKDHPLTKIFKQEMPIRS